MSKKWTILIVSLVIIVLFGIIIFSSFGYYKAEVYPLGEKRLLVRKIKNNNLLLNFLKPDAQSLITNGDLIIHKNPMVFDTKFSHKENYCSRVIGLPGDVITIKESQVFVNDVAVNADYDIYFLFRVSSDESQNFEKLLEPFNFEMIELLNNGKAANIITTTAEAEKMQEIEQIVNISKITKETDYNDPEMFCSKGNYFLWNKDNLGPLMVPQSEVTVFFNTRNIGIYKYLIQWHEDNQLEYDINKVSVNGQETDSYTIQQDYYFVLNDNRYSRDDSRIWGFIPEDQIVGKVIKK